MKYFVVLVALLATPVHAQSRTSIMVYNNSSRTVYSIQASNTQDENWGDNLLTQPLPPNYHIDIDVDDGSDACWYDFLATARNNITWKNSYDVCNLASWTLNN